MNTDRLMPQPTLTAEETLAADHLLDVLLAELSDERVVALDARRPAVPTETRVEVA